jgi:hypothetical protein
VALEPPPRIRQECGKYRRLDRIPSARQPADRKSILRSRI